MSRYSVNRIEYPSCTEILGQLDKSQSLMQWAVNQAIKYIELNGAEPQNLLDAKTHYREVSQEAMDIGSEVHKAIEQYIKYGKDKIGEIRDEVMQALIAFWDWEKANDVSWVESEASVVNEEHGFAGQLDAIGMVNGKLVCIDFKSSKAIYDEYVTQVCAYKYARESMSGAYLFKSLDENEWTKQYASVTIPSVGVLLLDKASGMPTYKQIDDPKEIKREYDKFLKLVDYYYLAKDRRLKNNPRAKAIKEMYK